MLGHRTWGLPDGDAIAAGAFWLAGTPGRWFRLRERPRVTPAPITGPGHTERPGAERRALLSGSRRCGAWVHRR
jgi:hypothetical protein